MSDHDHTDGPTCTGCGRALPADAPDGACPRCLLVAGLDGTDGDPDGTGTPTSVAPDGAAEGPPPPPSPEEMNERFPDLEVLDVLGQGGMGIVYRARQMRLDRIVALKVLPAAISSDPTFAERFTREARAMAKLTHPHIVGVHEFGERDGLYYLLMEYVDGANLREMMRGGHLEPAQALAIVPQICDALQFAHDRGVVHRDIKPENILVGRDGSVKIADFGLAKMAQRTPVDISITGTGQIMGTLHYMAPEQYRTPQDVDHRADLYSLGVVFYEMLTGDLPLGIFSPPSKLSAVDVRVDKVVLRALERERDRRWQHASDMKTEVDSVSHAGPEEVPPVVAAAAAGASSPPPGPATPPPAPTPTGPRRWSRLALFGFLLPFLSIIAIVVIAIVVANGVEPDGPPRWNELAGGTLLAAAASGVVLLVGFVLSLVGWVVIERSGGRLKGLPFAILGTLMPGLLCCVGVIPGWLLMATVGRDAVTDGPGGIVFDGQGIRISPPAPLPAPGIPVTIRPAGFQVDAAETQTQILNKMSALRATRRIDPADIELADLLPLYSPFDRDDLETMDTARRERLGLAGGLGLPLLDPALLPDTFDALKVVAIDVDAVEDQARVTLEGGGKRVLFEMTRNFSDWWFSLTAVDLGAVHAPMPADEEEATLPSTVTTVAVSGGPGWMTEADRAESARGITALWGRFTVAVRRDGLETAARRSSDWFAVAERSRFSMAEKQLFDALGSAGMLGLPFARPESGAVPFEKTVVTHVALSADGEAARVRVEGRGAGWEFPVVRRGGRWTFGIGPVVPHEGKVAHPIGQPLPIVVTGGPLDDVERWTEVTEIALLWGRSAWAAVEGGLVDGKGSLDLDAARWYVAEADRDALLDTDVQERLETNAQGLSGSLGWIGALAEGLSAPATDFSIDAITFEEPAANAAVRLRGPGGDTITFPVRRADGQWWFALGSVSRE